jgi:hypothetical protein
LEKITGDDKKDQCGDKKKRVAAHEQQPVVVGYVPVVQTSANDSSIEEISEDKIEGVLEHAPVAATGYEAN